VGGQAVRGVLERLATGELHLVREQDDGRAAELRDRDRERDPRPRRRLREVEPERPLREERLGGCLQLGGEIEHRLELVAREVPHAQEATAPEGSRRLPDQRSFAACTAAFTSPSRSPGGGGSNVPARTCAATCSCASRNGTPCLTSVSAASAARSSGSAHAAAIRSRSNSSPSTSTVSASSAPSASARAANTEALSSWRSRL